jgi:hypothetical protein
MKVYLIGYDLNKPRGQNDYTKLHEAIKKISGFWWCSLDSTWVVKSDKSAAQIRDILAPYLDSGDEMFVVAVGADWASQGLSKEATDWLHAQMPKSQYVNTWNF